MSKRDELRVARGGQQDRWLALDDERVRQQRAWSAIHRELERLPGWFALSEDERIDAERASGLEELEAGIRLIDRRLRRWLRRLPRTLSHDLGEVAANLRVAERLLPPEEDRTVNGLIRRAVRDLDRLRGLNNGPANGMRRGGLSDPHAPEHPSRSDSDEGAR